MRALFRWRSQLLPFRGLYLATPITPVAGLTTQVAAVITRNHAGTTHRQRGITSQHRGITTSRGFINRHHVITSRRHEPITGLIRIAAGMAITVAVGTAVTAVETTTIRRPWRTRQPWRKRRPQRSRRSRWPRRPPLALTNTSIKKRRMKRRFFMPGFQYSYRSARGCRPSQALWKCASTTASGTLLMSGQCQCGF